MNYEDLTGQRFGRLTVIERIKEKGKTAKWRCICDCGNEVFDTTSHIKNQRTSCGCIKAEGLTHYKHGGARKKANERLYAVWIDMKARCYNPGRPESKWYIDKGITVCDEWIHDYSAFRTWALENGYDPDAPRGKTTIDRIDNNKDYSPDNCRIVDAHIQRINQYRPFEHQHERRR